MRVEFAPYPLLVGISILLILGVVLWKKKRKSVYLAGFSMFWLYLLLVVSLAVFPIPLPESTGSSIDARQTAASILSHVNLAPFYFGRLFDLAPMVIFENLAGNILLTIPFGFGICFLTRVPVRRTLWLAFAVGLSIEAAQLVVSLLIGAAYRGVDINDVLLNAVGVWIGYSCFQVFTRLYRMFA